MWPRRVEWSRNQVDDLKTVCSVKAHSGILLIHAYHSEARFPDSLGSSAEYEGSLDPVSRRPD